MRLQPVRLASVWTCPVHAVVIEDGAGRCPLDGRPLIQVTVAESWTCPGDGRPSLSPGKCPDGSVRKRSIAPRPHGNHNPQHGGEFFMAADNWHHLEATYPRAGTFRLHLYDDYTRALPAALVASISGHVTMADGRDVPLTHKGQVLEASIGDAAFPLALQARVKFEPNGKENLFDFTFPAFTKENAGTGSGSTSPPGTPTAAGITLGLNAADIPREVPQLLQQLQKRSDTIRGLIQQGRYGTVYAPAFEAKDLALSLVDRTPAGSRHEVVESAVATLVRDTYLLDAYGDLANLNGIKAVFTDFSSALQTIAQAFPQVTP
jgi:hypothetical protein